MLGQNRARSGCAFIHTDLHHSPYHLLSLSSHLTHNSSPSLSIIHHHHHHHHFHYASQTSPLDNSNDRWKRVCLVSWAAAICVWTLRTLTGNLLTYLLTYLLLLSSTPDWKLTFSMKCFQSTIVSLTLYDYNRTYLRAISELTAVISSSIFVLFISFGFHVID